MLSTITYKSPLGTIILQSDENRLLRLDFSDEQISISSTLPSILKQTIQQVDEYFAGTRLEFTIPIHQQGTTFQVSVWKALTTIPYGEVKSYLDIATQVGNPKAVRAVGMTNGRNPLGIIVPCHRVIGKNGKMVGYASGVWRKEWLLNHEKNVLSSRYV